MSDTDQLEYFRKYMVNRLDAIEERLTAIEERRSPEECLTRKDIQKMIDNSLTEYWVNNF